MFKSPTGAEQHGLRYLLLAEVTRNAATWVRAAAVVDVRWQRRALATLHLGASPTAQLLS